MLLKNKEISREHWITLVAESPYASVFQTPDFCDFYNCVPYSSAEVFAITDHIRIKALCVVTLQKEPSLLGFFSRRAIIYGGPVLNGADEYEIDILVKSIVADLKGLVIYIEIRNLNDYSGFSNIFFKNHWKLLPYLNFKIDCSDADYLFNRFANNRKRQIKKALQTGVVIKEASCLEEVTCFYKMLYKLYSHKIKKPLPGIQFFHQFFKSNLGKYLVVEYEKTIIGGIMCPILSGKCIYELYIFGLDDEYKEQSPSVMATYGAMNYASKNNIPVFDFMGAGRKDQDYGVREFKSRFGGEQFEHGRFIRILNPLLYFMGRSTLSLIKALKK